VNRPQVVPLFPQQSAAAEAASWRQVFAWLADHPPAGDWRRDPRARALVAAAEAFIGGESQRRGA